MGKFLVLYGDAIDGITPAASGTDAGYAVADAVDGIVGSQHQYTGTSLTITWDAGNGNTIDAAGGSVHNHNIPAGSNVKYEWSTDNFSTTSASDPVTVNLGYDSHKIFSAARSYRYARLFVSVAASQAINVGEACLWTSSYAPTTFDLIDGYTIKRQINAVTALNWGQNFRSKVSRNRIYQFELIGIDGSAIDELGTISEEEAVCFVPDSVFVACYHGMMQGDGLEYQVFNWGHKLSMEFRENARRVT